MTDTTSEQSPQPAPAATAYLNLDEAEQRRQRELADGNFQELAPVLLPEEDGGHLGWPVATMVEDVIVVAFSKKTDSFSNLHSAVPGVIRSYDGGASWSQPRFLTEEMAGVENVPRRGTGMRAIGTTRRGRVVISAAQGIFVSDDHGETWQRLETTGLPTAGNAGPRIIDHPRFGLIMAVHRGRSQKEKRKETRCCLYRSPDAGRSWEELCIYEGQRFTPGEPTLFMWNDEDFGIFSRNHTGPVSGRDKYFFSWSYYCQVVPSNLETAEEFSDLRFSVNFVNIYNRRMDTPDADYNPVSGRIEAVVPKRNEGFPWHDNGWQTLTLWSLAPDDFAHTQANWRFECVLLRSEGMMCGSEDPAYPLREGLHPAGAVIDEKRGLQHFFIFGGDNPHIAKRINTGRTGIFRLSRSLDTRKYSQKLRRLDRFEEHAVISEDFSDLKFWTLSGSPIALDIIDKNRVDRKVTPLPDGIVKTDENGLVIRTGQAGYYGLHHEKVMVLPDYEINFQACIERYTENGETLAIGVNAGAQRQLLVLQPDGVYFRSNSEGELQRLKKLKMDHRRHDWRLEMRNGIGKIYLDGELLGRQEAVFDDTIGQDDTPLKIYSRIDTEADPAIVRIRRFTFKNCICNQ